jgi:hypothetical protein
MSGMRWLAALTTAPLLELVSAWTRADAFHNVRAAHDSHRGRDVRRMLDRGTAPAVTARSFVRTPPDVPIL